MIAKMLITIFGILASWFAFLFSLVMYNKPKSSSLFSGNILLVTAHPDDECVFFSPTLDAIRADPSAKLFLLCLSNGDGDGLGKVREKELENYCTKVIPFQRFECVNAPYLQDGFDQVWKQEKVAYHVERFVHEHNINQIITFDDYGVSGHPNHISTYHGVKFALQNLSMISAFRLKSYSMIDKYILGTLQFVYRMVFKNEQTILTTDPLLAYRGLLVHESQCVWYRRLFVVISRFAWMNTWEIIQSSDRTCRQ